MAAPHYHHCHHNNPCTTILSHPSCGCCCNRILSPPPKTDSDHLAQALAQLLLQRQQETSFNACPCLTRSPNLNPRVSSRQPERTFYPELQHLDESGSVISLLTQRIIRLESVLCRDPSFDFRAYESDPLRSAAASIIQSRFRAFLVRRSRVLRQLQQLGRLKATFLALKSKVSQNNRVDYHFVCIDTMNMLLKLQSIQDDHPMIKDGKRLITREMVRFLDFIESSALRRNGGRSALTIDEPANHSNMSMGRSRRKILEELSDRLDRIRGFPDHDQSGTKASTMKSALRLKKMASIAENELNSNTGIIHMVDDEDDVVEDNRRMPRYQNDDKDTNSESEAANYEDFVLSSLIQKQTTDPSKKKHDIRILG